MSVALSIYFTVAALCFALFYACFTERERDSLHSHGLGFWLFYVAISPLILALILGAWVREIVLKKP